MEFYEECFMSMEMLYSVLKSELGFKDESLAVKEYCLHTSLSHILCNGHEAVVPQRFVKA